MYIIKNAFKCIGRSMGRNILIGIIALVIAVSACIGLSIRQAADSAKESALAGMSVTGTISYDRQSMMQNMKPSNMGDFTGGFDKEMFNNMMGSTSSLTLEEYLVYAGASSVSSFYYTLTAYFDGSEGLEPVTTSSTSSSSGSMGGFFPGGNMPSRGSDGDFTVIGYSSDLAMTDFQNGTATRTEGVMFDEGTTAFDCIVSQELATYNGIEVGETILLNNPNNASESYILTVVGIYKSTASNNFDFTRGGSDPVNSIYMSSAALDVIVNASASREDNGTDTRINGMLSATYVFADVEDFYAFEDEVRDLGLDTSYTVSSPDITEFENKLTPLKTLGTMAGWFLVVILAIGGVILVVLNIFNVRERKYEIGVLTAMGMKKWKVATQFICEILVITMAAIIIGAGIGAISSVPVTNALLENQITSQINKNDKINGNFGRPGNMGSFPGGDMPDMGGMGGFGGFDFSDGFMNGIVGGAADYVSEIDSAMNLTVVFQMIGIGILLTLIASAASVVFVMRYDPLKILSNRD